MALLASTGILPGQRITDHSKYILRVFQCVCKTAVQVGASAKF